MPKAIIFDMDGVLVDSEPLHFKVERQVFDELGLQISSDEHHSYVGMVPLQIWTVIREKHGLAQSAEALKKKEQDRKFDLFRKSEIPLVPGVRQLLDRLEKAGIPLSLASSSPKRIIQLFTEKTGTTHFFRHLLSGEEVPNGKPAPDIFLRSAQLLNTPPNSCIVIEDSANGVRAAKSAGMHCIGFQNPNSGDQDLSSADLVIEAFSTSNIDSIFDWVAP